MTDFVSEYQGFAEAYLGRDLRASDGISEATLRATERRLRLRLPRSLRHYYRRTGRCDPLNRVHNQLRSPIDLCVDDGFLVFMDENQSVVSWGLRLDRITEEDPVVWQRNNTPPVAWYSERKRFVAFLRSMFNWYSRHGVFSSP